MATAPPLGTDKSWDDLKKDKALDSIGVGTNFDARAEDQRLRRNIQWGIVRGLFVFMLCMTPVWLALAIAITILTGH